MGEQRTTVVDDADAAIAARLRQLREDRALSQADLADSMTALGFKWRANTVAMVERQKRRLKTPEVFSASFCLGVTLQEFFAPGDSLGPEEFRSEEWSFMSTWVAFNPNSGKDQPRPPGGLNIRGQHFDDYWDARDYLAKQVEEQKVRRTREDLEEHFSRSVSLRLGKKAPTDWIRLWSNSLYTQDVLTERNSRIFLFLSDQSGSSGIAKRLGHVTRQMTQEMTDYAVGDGGFLAANVSHTGTVDTETKGETDE